MNFYYIDTLVKVEVALVDYTAFPHEAAAGGVDLGLGLFGFDFKYTGLAPYLHAVGLCLVDARCVGKFGSYYRSHLHYKRVVAYGYTVDPCVSQSVTFVGRAVTVTVVFLATLSPEFTTWLSALRSSNEPFSEGSMVM